MKKRIKIDQDVKTLVNKYFKNLLWVSDEKLQSLIEGWVHIRDDENDDVLGAKQEARKNFFNQLVYLRDEQRNQLQLGKLVRFSHIDGLGDKHLLIDGEHNAVVCPECIQPGIITIPNEEL